MRIHILSFLLVILAAFIVGVADLVWADAQPEGDEMTQPDAIEALSGRSWRLVQIMSMDDTIYVPEDRSKYTLTFAVDGNVQIRADCNRGTGSWKSPAPGKLTFGQIAATQAQCPPGSLHVRYMAQFPWVRSYVVRDGSLFFATMADGSIVEFEPVPPTATVLGDDISTADPDEMQQVVLTRLFDRYAKQHGIEVTEDEIDAYVDDMQRGMRAKGLTAEKELSPEEAAQVVQMKRDIGSAMIQRWKLNKALYAQYGGRIIFQQFGPEPLDAYRRYLEERHAAGDFDIYDHAMAEAFWRYFTDDSLHSFYQPGSEEERQAFAAPWGEGTHSGD